MDKRMGRIKITPTSDLLERPSGGFLYIWERLKSRNERMMTMIFSWWVTHQIKSCPEWELCHKYAPIEEKLQQIWVLFFLGGTIEFKIFPSLFTLKTKRSSVLMHTTPVPFFLLGFLISWHLKSPHSSRWPIPILTPSNPSSHWEGGRKQPGQVISPSQDTHGKLRVTQMCCGTAFIRSFTWILNLNSRRFKDARARVLLDCCCRALQSVFKVIGIHVSLIKPLNQSSRTQTTTKESSSAWATCSFGPQMWTTAGQTVILFLAPVLWLTVGLSVWRLATWWSCH